MDGSDIRNSECRLHFKSKCTGSIAISFKGRPLIMISNIGFLFFCSKMAYANIVHKLEGFRMNFTLARLGFPVTTCLTTLLVFSVVLASTYLTKQQSKLLLYKMTVLETNSSLMHVAPSNIIFWRKIMTTPQVMQGTIDTICSVTSKPPKNHHLESNSTFSCPNYFQWIYEDLSPWRRTGISNKLILRARSMSNFRVVIVTGRLFVEAYRPCFQTRSLFTLWGILQLLKHHANLVPDVDFMFSCQDRPVISPATVQKNSRRLPPPLFRYCSSLEYYDIPFPDWSFWGWPELKLRPWDKELLSIVRSSTNVKWADRRPTAYWKGNPLMSYVRMKLLKCNSSNFGAEIFTQDWISEAASGFSQSNLSDQCRHRYKIYAEGKAWSASLKYLLACDSPVLLINPQYHDFFTRGLVPQVSYWPIRPEKLCESIKFGVDWGNAHHAKARAMGTAGRAFISQDVSMARVYDYMLHLLTQYSKLLDFKPSVPPNAVEVSTDFILCQAQPREKAYLQQSAAANEERRRAGPCGLHGRDGRLVRRMEDLKEANMRNAAERENNGRGGKA